jgi:hypothetical protein
MKKHLLNKHQNDFVEYKIELESIKGGVGEGREKKTTNSKKCNHRLIIQCS